MSIDQVPEALGPSDSVYAVIDPSALALQSAYAPEQDGIPVVPPLTGGERSTGVESGRLSLEFAFGDEVKPGMINARRGHFQAGGHDFAGAEVMWPDRIARLLAHLVRGPENYEEMFRALFEAQDAFKVYAIVSEH
jgi:hypothetical protein